MAEFPSQGDLIDALAGMWSQYCPPPYGHAGSFSRDRAEEVLRAFRVLTDDGEVDWDEVKTYG